MSLLPPARTDAVAGNGNGSVPRLTDLCLRVLSANVAFLQDVGDVPYEFLRGILPGCKVDQLREIEDYSPQIADADDGTHLSIFRH